MVRFHLRLLVWPALASHDDRRLRKPDSGAGTAAHRRPPGRSRPPADPIKRSNSLETVARHRRLEPNYSERSGRARRSGQP